MINVQEIVNNNFLGGLDSFNMLSTALEVEVKDIFGLTGSIKKIVSAPIDLAIWYLDAPNVKIIPVWMFSTERFTWTLYLKCGKQFHEWRSGHLPVVEYMGFNYEDENHIYFEIKTSGGGIPSDKSYLKINIMEDINMT